MDVIAKIVSQAQADIQRIILSEGGDERTLIAADKLVANKVADIIIMGNPVEINDKAKALGLENLSGATIIDPINNPKKEEYASFLYELRKSKGMTMEQAMKLAEDPLYLAPLMIKKGDADGEIAGACNATSSVLRPAFQIVKTAPGVSVVSGLFIMVLKDNNLGEDGVMTFADCAVCPDPTAEELAQIAISTAETTKALAGFEPRVAMLSFSTKGSAKHERIDKVIEATKLAKERCPEIMLDGEMQLDAAIVPEVGASKAPGSPVAGKANVLVFPSLEAGNIGYKLVQRFAGATAIGPILQGLAAPINDLSRGCSAEDIYLTVAVAAVQSIQLKASRNK
ncbi:MAG: phosphate acetyltransferase [Bacteroidales bacterium]|nr:phosphate acetyltransferase [Bacteroidales bacterium]MBQ7819656.1 phosphate acetyltransferase [Bacteroidales bacterium]